MKEFHNFVYKHIVTLKNHKRYIAMLTALSIFVSFMVPLILIEPADSMTKQRLMMLNKTSSGMAMVDNLNDGQTANNNYSPGQLSEVALLIGEFTPGDYETKLEWVEGCTTAAEVVEAAKREYFLGIASDFCVFLENDFTPKGADAEGRVAVGGNITFTGDYNYQLGAGDYTTMTALINTDNYNGVTNFAHAIVGGYVKRINMLSTVGNGSLYYERPDASSLYQTGSGDSLTVYYPENEDLYKRIAIGNATAIDNCQHMTWLSSNNWTAKDETYNTYCEHDKFHPNELAQFYQADLIDFEAVFEWLKTQSQKLSNKTATGTIIDSNDPSVIIFDGSSLPSDTPTIYFELDNWSENYTEIRFQNVPENANLVVNCGGKDIKFHKEVKDKGEKISTYINGKCISKFDANSNVAKDDNGKNVDNNNKKSEQILYNFYEAEDLFIFAHLNGTILAPNADVKSEANDGAHLSGSMIAKSFEGGLEFGYRPYRGGTDILGSTAGYVVPFDKFVDDLIENDENPRLEGATFEIKEGDEIVDTWTSTEETSYITFPTELDFTGGKTYDETNQTVTHTYTISEKSAPEGYAITTETYSVKVKETVDLSSLLRVEGGTIPTRAAVEIKIFKNDDDETPVHSCNMIIEDTYSDSGIIQRIIAIDGTPKEYYVLDIANGKINSVGKPTNPSALDYIWTESAEIAVDIQPMNVDTVDILEDDTNSSGEDTEETTEESTEEPTQSENQEETVEKTDPPIPTGLTIEYGKALKTVALPDGWTWNSPNDTVSATVGSTVSHKAKYTPSETSNYNAVERDITLTVEKTDPPIPTGLTIEYGKALNTVALPDGWTWNSPNDTVSETAGSSATYKATYTPSETSNYNAVEENITLTVTKAQPTVNPVLDPSSGYTQGQGLPAISISNGDTAGTISWVNSTAKFKYGENVLAWKFTPDEGNNYEETTGEITITASAIPTNVITINDKNTAQKLTDSNFYYDPTSLMIMPLPNETPSFTNDYALVFKKQDESGNALLGATIELQSGTISSITEQSPDGDFADVSTPLWNWNSTSTSSYTIPLSEIDENKFYRFYEDTPPEKYEAADPIYFYRQGTKVYYTNDKSKLTTQNSWDVLNLTEDQHTIVMTDNKIFGPKIKLLKVKEGTNTTLEGAQFELYAVSGDTLVYPTNNGTKLTSDAEGEIDFTDVFKANPDNCNTEYIKNGYLIPGEYYLQETIAPNGYEAPTDKMYFVVNEDYTVVAEKPEEPTYILANSSQITGTHQEDNSYENVTAIEVICTSPKGETDLLHKNNGSNNGNLNIQGETNWIQGMAEWTSLFRNNSLGSYQLTDLGGNKYKVTYNFNSPVNIDGAKNIQYQGNDGVVLNEVRIYGESANSSTGSGGGDVAFYTINNIVWNDSNLPSVTVDKLKFYYDDGTEPQEVSNVSVSNGGNGLYWHEFNLSGFTKKDHVIGIQITVGGSGTGKLKIKSGNEFILGTLIDSYNSEKYESVSAGQTYTLGVTELPTDDNEELPGDSNESGESNENQNGNSPLITVDDSSKTIKIGNVEKGAYTDITVKKEWADSENLYNTRPEKVIVQLYQTDENGTSSLFAATAKHPNTVELNSGNNWTYTWEDLPSKIGETDKHYTYTVVEETVSGYTASYENGTNEITITNTLISKDIPVEKKWLDYNRNETTSHPDSVTVQLQKHNGTGYVDVTGKTIVLSDDNGWKASFENLPNGSYQIVENVPTGWTPSYSNQRITIDNNTTTISTCVITNTQETGSLGVQKIWSGGVARPEYITVNIYRTTIPPNSGTTGGDTNVNIIAPLATKYGNVTEDYARLLQYSLYFYDANMCGDTNSILSWRDDCHIGDEVDGGFHDAGDHVMFGLPQGFTASTLGWSYYEFKDSFDKLGITKHYQVIMKEFCDFFVASTTLDASNNVTNFLYQKGNGDTDHAYWGSPEQQAVRNSEMYYTNNSASDIAAEYAAALAIHYLNFPNDENAETYLTYAKALYEFSTKYNSCLNNNSAIYSNKEGRYFYESTGEEYKDDQAWAGVWLYLITKDSNYLNPYNNYFSGNNGIGWVHCWDNVSLGTACVYAEHIDNNHDWSKVKSYLEKIDEGGYYNNGLIKDGNGNYNYWFLDGWGSARYNATMQLAAMVATTYSTEDDIDYSNWCKDQMTYLLGGKEGEHKCYVTGFTGNSARYPHHRAASGYQNVSIENYTTYDPNNGHVLVGALVGGPSNAAGSYTDSVKDYQCSEVALDYNAGLVGAAAALYSVYGTGNTVTKDVMVADRLETSAEKIYEEDAYAEYVASQQARTANIEYNAVGPVNLSKLSFKRNAVSVLDNNTVEMMYPAYTEFGTVNATKEIKFNPKYENVTRIELDYVISGNNGGYNMYFYPNNGSFGSGEKIIIDEDTFGFSVPDWANGVVTGFKLEVWGIDSFTISEIRFYYEGTGPSITINNAPTTALKVGATHSLTATGVDSISWSSSSSDKVSVDSTGKVTIKGYPNGGVATITAYDTTNDKTNAQITINVLPMTITLNPASISKGGTSDVIFTNAPDGEGWTYSYDYSPKDENGLTISDSGVITANKSGEYTITATVSKGEITASATANLTVTSNFDAKFDGNTTEKTMHLGAFENGVNVNVYNNEGSVYYSSDREDLISIDQNTGTITLNHDAVIEESTPITITATDESNNPKTLTLTIVPDITITSNDEDAKININDEIVLTANNLIGNTATWEIIDGTDVIEFVTQNVQQLAADTTETSNIENGSAQITVKGKGYGTAIVEVTDSAGGSAQYTIIVEIVPVDVNTDGLDPCGTLTITSANDWTATMANLPKYDANGNLYYYYIEEVMTNGDHIAVSGGKYVPVSYINGTNLNSDKTLEVTNAFVEVDEQGTLPSTGGSGVKTYYYFGGALMLLGIAGFTGLKRRERKRREE